MRANVGDYEGDAMSDKVLFFETPCACCDTARHVDDAFNLA